MLFDKLSDLIDKYSYSCNKELYILTDDIKNNLVQLLIKNHTTAKIKYETDDFDDACVILIIYNNINTFNNKIIEFINDHIHNRKTIIMVTNLNFDFDNLIKKTKANSIDAISLRDNNKKLDEYIIVINKN
jgi:hypothetical protein